jgi:hypothetical protein
MAKLELKGGRKPDHKPEAEKPKSPAKENPAPVVVVDPPAPELTPEELRSAWLALEAHHPLTEEALGEVLRAFLAGRRG